MLPSTIRRTALLLLSAALVTSCTSERPTASAPITAPAPANGLLGLSLVSALQRTAPLATPITVSATIGSAGGTLAIPAAGVTVTVPKGALASNVAISMTARAGSSVAYDFAPHGITFAKPLTFQQTLAGTNANPLLAPLMQLGYYANPAQLTSTGALVNELIPGTLNLKLGTFTSSIAHFSGYICASGRADRE